MRRHVSPLKKAFNQHRIGARNRGIEFLLEYGEWLEIWKKSGKLDQRGNKGGQYVMARYGDIGPYSVENVKIITLNDNVSEGHIGLKHSIEARKKMSDAWRPQPESVNKKISQTLKGRSKSEEHKLALSEATRAAQARMRAEGRHIGRPPKPLKTNDSTDMISTQHGVRA